VWPAGKNFRKEKKKAASSERRSRRKKGKKHVPGRTVIAFAGGEDTENRNKGRVPDRREGGRYSTS